MNIKDLNKIIKSIVINYNYKKRKKLSNINE